MDVSPPESPGSGPLQFDEEDSLSFTARFFYSTNKMAIVPIASHGEANEEVHHSHSILYSLVTAEKPNSVEIIAQSKCEVTNISYANSFGCERPDNENGSTSVNTESQSSLIGDENVEAKYSSSRERNENSKSSAFCKKEKNNKTKLIALSPIKNQRFGSVEEEASDAEFSAAQMPASIKKRRASSVCSSLKPKPNTRRNSKSQPVHSADDGTASNLMLTKSQKFSKKMVPSLNRQSNNQFGVSTSTVESKHDNIAAILTPPIKRKFFKTMSPGSKIIVGNAECMTISSESQNSFASDVQTSSADGSVFALSQPMLGEVHQDTDGSVSAQPWPLLDDVHQNTSKPSSPCLQTEKDSDDEEVTFYSIFSNQRGRKQVAISRNSKNQLYEVSPSKRMRLFKEKMDVSPPESPGSGPLQFDEEDSPSFTARSFYSTTKKMAIVPIASHGEANEEVHHSPSILYSLVTAEKPKSVAIIAQSKCGVTRKNIRYAKSFGCERPDNENGSTSVYTESQSSLIGDENVEAKYSSSRERNENSKSSAFCKKEKNNKTKLIALSPIKNRRFGSVEKEASDAEFSAAQMPASIRKRRASSVCSSLQPKPKTRKKSKSQPVHSADDGTASNLMLTKSQKFSKKMVPSLNRQFKNQFGVSTSTVESKHDNIAAILTPPIKRKFFKTKSPGSKIIVGKGFDLKFVQPLKKVSNRSVGTKKRPKQKSSTNGKNKNSTSSADGSVSTLSQPMLGEVHQDTDGSVSAQPWPLLDDVHQDTSKPSSPCLQTEKDSDEEEVKFYSIFSNQRGRKQVAISRNSKNAIVSSMLSVSPEDGAKVHKISPGHGDDKQLILDAGQEKFGATQCQICGMVYTPTDLTDDATHSKFHQHAMSALRFPGWKKENVVKEYLEDGSRVIVIVPDDRRYKVKKVQEVNQVMGQELGFPDQVFCFHGSYKAFLYISENKMIEGCCIAEAIKQGYPIMPPIGRQDVTDSRPWLCSNTPQPASVGIGRLWVYGPSRQKGIAMRLLDCVRQWFEYGILIPKKRVAFSDPTPDGRNFAAKYTGTPHFLVYKTQ